MRLLVIVLFFSLVSPLHAAEGRRVVTINKVLSFSSARPIDPSSEGYIRVYVNDGLWTGAPSCRTDAADLKAEDDHSLSILMFAWATDKPIEIGVDDSVKPIDSACQISFILVN